MREFYKAELKKIQEEYKTVSDKETRRKIDLIMIMEKFEHLIKTTNEREV